MTHAAPDALVLFGATGDLAKKKIYPALQGLVRRGRLDVPVVGIARAGWDVDGMRRHVHESLEQSGSFDAEAAGQLARQMRYVDSDYTDPATFEKLRKALGDAKRPLHYLAIPPSLFPTVVEGLGRSGTVVMGGNGSWRPSGKVAQAKLKSQVRA